MKEEDWQKTLGDADRITAKARAEMAQAPKQEPVPASPPALKVKNGPFIGDGVFKQALATARNTRESSIERIKQNARDEIERDVIDKMPRSATAEDKQFVRDRAEKILDGENLPKIEPGSFWDRKISPDFNRHAAKEERDGDQPGRGKGGGPDITKDPPNPPGGGPSRPSGGATARPAPDKAHDVDARGSGGQPGPARSKFIDDSKSSHHLTETAKDAGTAKQAPERAGVDPSKSLAETKADQHRPEKTADTSKGQEASKPPDINRSKFFDNSKTLEHLSDKTQDASKTPEAGKENEAPQQESGVQSQFLKGSKSEQHLSGPSQDADKGQDAGQAKEAPDQDKPEPQVPEQDER